MIRPHLNKGRSCHVLSMILATAVLSGMETPAMAKQFEWAEASPQSQGLDPAKLDALRRDLAKRRTKAFLVIRHDRIVYEWYAPGHSRDKKHYTASMAKALVGGVCLALAIDEGRISIDDPVAKFVPQWRNDPLKRQITIRHLGSHTSGLEDAQPKNEKGWKENFWKRLDPPRDPFTISRDRVPVLFEPGAQFQYSNPGIAMLGYALAAALRGAGENNLRTLLRDRVMRPIGVRDRDWSVGYGRVFTVDGLPLIAPWGGGGYTARAAARVGRLMLRRGDWDGKQIICEEAVRLTTSSAGLPGAIGMGWWTNGDRMFDSLPRDAFWAAGAGHQTLLVVPSLDLICVRNGGALASGRETDQARGPYLFDPLMAAIADVAARPPYPASPVIRRIVWAPKDTIVRKARGSDNWPLTWADDDNLYTAYGDGWGFEPRTPQKLSLGLAKVTGAPGDFVGINIRSSTAEQIGDGKRGKKASGMLMVEGTLYMWVRNADNSQLAWSRDHGQTWQWSDWTFTTSFGCPTFLNFGRNYEGARDDFVYVYSFDSDTAYDPADCMVLARVPKDRLLDRSAYEFFVALGGRGEPQWTKDIGARGPVFANPARCYRSGITYNRGLRRYLWCQILPESTDRRGPRYQGGFGIYDASEPWGPWTTAYFTQKWDVGPGETASFPTKWMSDDGRTLWLAFSGDDCFSVRQARIVLVDERVTVDRVTSVGETVTDAPAQ